MRKLFFFATVLIQLSIAAVLLYLLFRPVPVREANAQEFARSFQLISGEAVIEDLSEFTAFEWDTLLAFAPYTTREYIYGVVGYEWESIRPTVSEGMNQVVFLKDGEVVCYLHGYPDRYRVYFDFGAYPESHLELSAASAPSFKTQINEDGIRVFTYVR